MAQQEFCQTCKQENDCRRLYRELGGVKSPSVVSKVVLAFLLPLVVFIGSLAAFERILAGAMGKNPVVTAMSLLLALSATFACIVITGVIRK